MEFINRLIANPEHLFLLIPVLAASFLVYLGIFRPLFRRDYTVFKTKENKFLINLLNWKAPNWGTRFESHFRHYGPILVVSNAVYMTRCGRGCCQIMEIKGQERSNH